MAGAELHAFLQRCACLFENPCGGPTHPIVLSEANARLVAVLTGSILDVLRTNAASNTTRMIQFECPDESSVILTLAVAAFDGRGSAGFSLLTRASQFCEVRHGKDLVRIVARFTGWSLRAEFESALTEQPAG